MTRPEAARLVTVIFAACPAQSAKLGHDQQIAMVDAFATLLDDVPYEHANAAVRVLLQTRPWMPSVADIRATVRELLHGPVPPGGEQWGVVLKAIGKYGAWRTPGVDFVFDDAITAKCVEALGWRMLCLSDNPVADRARFVEMYDKLAEQSRREDVAPVLGAAREARALPAAGGNPIQQALNAAPPTAARGGRR
jgi:hypothetical protein